MSKASKLSTAIASFNVSECVKIGDEIQQDWLIPTDLEYWASLEVTTVSELEEILNFRNGYSDYYKSIHGFRPRWDTTLDTLSDWRNEYANLEASAEIVRKQEQEQERIDIQSFKDSIAKIKQNGAKDYMTALRWMMEAEDVNRRHPQAVELFFWNHGILYSSYGKSLLNRIYPKRKR